MELDIDHKKLRAYLKKGWRGNTEWGVAYTTRF